MASTIQLFGRRKHYVSLWTTACLRVLGLVGSPFVVCVIPSSAVECIFSHFSQLEVSAEIVEILGPCCHDVL